MRKIKADRNIKKVKNSMSDFYLYYTKHPGFAEKLKKLSNKEIVKMTDRIKIVIDDMYLKLKIEEKYMYWTNISELNSLLCVYFNRENKFLRLLDKNLSDEKVSEKIEKKIKIDIIKNKLGYETAFNNEIYKKADDCLYWLFICMNKYISFYYGRLKNDNPDEMAKRVDRILEQSDLLYKRNENKINKEINYINNILSRVKYARDNIDVIYSLPAQEHDKKFIKMFKGVLTKIENIMNLIICDIEEVYAA